jgi:hypothetical protein
MPRLTLPRLAAPAAALLFAIALSAPAWAQPAPLPTAADAPALITVRATTAPAVPTTAPTTAPAATTAPALDPVATLRAWNLANRDLDADAATAIFIAATPAETRLVNALHDAIQAERRFRDAAAKAMKIKPDALPPTVIVHPATDADISKLQAQVAGDTAHLTGDSPVDVMRRVDGRWRMPVERLMARNFPPDASAQVRAEGINKIAAVLERIAAACNDITRDIERKKFETLDDMFETLKVETQAAAREKPTTAP